MVDFWIDVCDTGLGLPVRTVIEDSQPKNFKEMVRATNRDVSRPCPAVQRGFVACGRGARITARDCAARVLLRAGCGARPRCCASLLQKIHRYPGPARSGVRRGGG